MPHTDCAKKRLRQNKKRRIQNRSVRSELRSQMKRVLAAVKAGNREQAASEYRIVQHMLDKAAVRRYLHPNTAYRYKSRLANRVNGLTSKPASA